MTKEQLRDYKDLKKERDELERKIEELEESLYGARTQVIDGMPHCRSGNSDVREKQLDKKTELVDLYQSKEKELSERLLVIEKAISMLPVKERRLIRLHYVEGMTWEQVCVEMNYSWSQVHRFHRDALKKLREEEFKTA